MTQSKKVVAVVDDDPRITESLEELFESAGYSVRSFLSPMALLASGLSDVDVLITDIGMPGMDGFELRDIVKKKRPEIPVFLVTGRHEVADQSRAQGIGRLFRKPFDGPILLTAVGDALEDQEGG